jgi:hypothetical protein
MGSVVSVRLSKGERFMPLRDHFRIPLSQSSSWEEVHGQWPAVIVQQLGKILPAQYVAGPRIHLGSQAEVDVVSFEHYRKEEKEVPPFADNGGSVATIVLAPPVWAPSQPTLVMETDLGDYDEYEVRVYDASRNRRLVAAIELISPENKDRPQSRRQLVAKFAALLRQQVSVMLVDIVGSRAFNLYAELLEITGQRDPALGNKPPSMYACACRWRPRGENHVLETWNFELFLAHSLPTLPLWLSEELAVPLNLESSYEQTCRDLRIA